MYILLIILFFGVIFQICVGFSSVLELYLHGCFFCQWSRRITGMSLVSPRFWGNRIRTTLSQHKQHMKENVSFVCAFQARRCVKELVLSFLNNVENNQHLNVGKKTICIIFPNHYRNAENKNQVYWCLYVHHPASLNQTRHCRFTLHAGSKEWNTMDAKWKHCKGWGFNVRSVAVWYFRSPKVMFVMFFTELFVAI